MTKAKFDKYGVFCIERKDKFKQQKCVKDEGQIYCCDECPKLSEPSNVVDGTFSIELCDKHILIFSHFYDER